MKEIIINVDKEQNKTALILENGNILEKYEETRNQRRLEGNIYLGVVKNVLVGMQACFVDIGESKNTFMHIKDIIPKVNDKTGNRDEDFSKYNIKKYIKPGMKILVQVKRDSTDKKGARISTHINMVGRYIVYLPDSEIVTTSQKIEDENEKDELIKKIRPYIEKNEGVILRTMANTASTKELKKDLEYQRKRWREIISKKDKLQKPTCLLQNDGMIEKILLDLVGSNIDRILVNEQKEYENIKNIVENMGEDVKIELRQENLLKLYNIEKELEKIQNRKIWLKCGGFITIDVAEALTAIDVNTGKYTGKNSLEETVLKVNKEATIEIAKQLKLRDLGGIIIIDYIDMKKKEDKEIITKLLNTELKKDRSKTQVIGFTKLDLLEMTRRHMFS